MKFLCKKAFSGDRWDLVDADTRVSAAEIFAVDLSKISAAHMYGVDVSVKDTDLGNVLHYRVSFTPKAKKL